MPRPIRAEINPAAIFANLEQIKCSLGASKIMPIVKANAYGHGLDNVYGGLANADALALLEIEGAAKLRALGWKKPIVLLEGCFDRTDLNQAIDLDCDWVVHCVEQFGLLNELKKINLRYKPRIFLKLNTGMNRLGFPVNKVPSVIQSLNELATAHGWATPVLMTHFANADEGPPWQRIPRAQSQHQLLMGVKPAHWQTSLGNSAGIFNFPDLVGDIARPGIALYGATPGPHAASHYGLKAAMRFTSQIIAIQNLSQGESVGYGSRWQAATPARIAVVACGYADGYPRLAPEGTPTFVERQIAPIAGRVSMDMLTINVTHIPNAQVGSTVELWGENVSVDLVAHQCATIGYELLCAVAPRVPFQIVPKD